MKLLGTIDEWLEYKPNAWLTNKKYLQEGVYIHTIIKKDKPEKCTYPIGRKPGDYEDEDNMHRNPMIRYGSQCPYIVRGSFTYFCGVVYEFCGAGAYFPLSDEMVNDPNWKEYKEQNSG